MGMIAYLAPISTTGDQNINQSSAVKRAALAWNNVCCGWQFKYQATGSKQKRIFALLLDRVHFKGIRMRKLRVQSNKNTTCLKAHRSECNGARHFEVAKGPMAVKKPAAIVSTLCEHPLAPLRLQRLDCI